MKETPESIHFKKPINNLEQESTGELNEIRRASNLLINQESNKENPPTKEEIERAVNQINEQRATKSNIEEVISKINEAIKEADGNSKPPQE